MTALTYTQLDEAQAELSALADQLRDQGMFDEADIVEAVFPFLALAREHAPLLSDVTAEEEVTGDMSTLRDLCVKMRSLQTEAGIIKAQAGEVKIQLDDLRMRKIPDLMAHLEIQNMTFKGIGRVQLAADLRASTKKGMKPKAIQWLRDLGYDGMITETYNSSTLKSLLRQQLLEGVDPPEELFNIFPFTRASIVKA